MFEEEEGPVVKNRPEVIVEEQTSNIKDMLMDAGLLKIDQEKINEDHGSALKFSSNSSFKSYSDNNMSANEFCTY